MDHSIEKLRKDLETRLKSEWKSFLKTDQTTLELRFSPFSASESKKSLQTTLSHESKNSLLKILGQESIYSVSHTETPEGLWVLIAGYCTNSKHPVGPSGFVGVDMEYALRPLHPELGKRISTSDEKNSTLSPLEIWTIKEACYKANPENQGTVLRQYAIAESLQQNGHSGHVLTLGTPLQRQIYFQTVCTETFTFAFAKERLT